MKTSFLNRTGSSMSRRLRVADLPPPPEGLSGWPWTEAEATCSLPSSKHDAAALPRIGIVTPSYNQAGFLEKTIRSVLLQGYPNLEYVIVDGGSTDGSRSIIKKYADYLKWWCSEADMGQSAAINKGVAQLSCDLIGWLNSDDYFFPGAIDNIVGLWRENRDATAWIGAVSVEYVERPAIVELARVGTVEELADWGWSAYFWQPGCFFRLRDLGQLGGIDEALHYAMDFDLWLKLRRLGEFVTTDEVVAGVNIRPEIKTLRDIPARDAEIVYICWNQGLQGAARLRMTRFSETVSLTKESLGRKCSSIKTSGLFYVLVSRILANLIYDFRRAVACLPRSKKV